MQIARLRSRIKTNIAALLPRCEMLDRSLPASMQQHKGYRASKLHRSCALRIGEGPPEVARHGLPVDPPAAIRHCPVAACTQRLREFLAGARRILCVGDPTVPALRDALGSRFESLTTVQSGEGATIRTKSGMLRAGTDSFAEWMAMREEADRAAIGVFVLTRRSGQADVELLRHRVYPHHRVLVEAGSPALTWLLAAWGGVVVRSGDVFMFSEPARYFREPSGRFRLAPATDWPRISVVTVSFNQREYLEACLHSVLSQEYPNLEYIVVDGGSSDGSAELLREYQRRRNCFAHLIIEPDKGQSDGLNKGFRLVTGDILTWVNSDDLLAPLSLRRAAMALIETGADLVAGTCRRIGGVDGHLLYHHHSALPTLRPVPFSLDAPLDWGDSWEQADWFFQPEVFFTRDIWERSGGYLKPYLYWAMDWDLWLRCALAGARIVRIPDVLGASREHAAQKTTSAETYLWQIVGILREYDDMLSAVEASVGVAA